MLNVKLLLKKRALRGVRPRVVDHSDWTDVAGPVVRHVNEEILFHCEGLLSSLKNEIFLPNVG